MADETDDGRRRRLKAQKTLLHLRDVAGKEDMELPSPDSDLWQKAREYLELPENGSNTPAELPDNWAIGDETTWWLLSRKVSRIIRPRHPEPGTAFSYEDWKAGQHNNKAIVDIVRERTDWHNHTQPFKPRIPAHRRYTINLQETFREKGLQIIVKMDSIELTQENPAYSSGSWQHDGQLNEHIVAVAIFAYDVDNITQPRIAFRQQTKLDGCFYQYDETKYTTGDYDFRSRPAHLCGKLPGKEIDAVAQILGIPPDDLLGINMWNRAFQSAGSVATLQGRLIAFPSVLEHRVEPLKLVDPSVLGHCRWIKLYLVDPHYRVCSTRNVPPQQHHWWPEAVGNDLAAARLPREIVDGILQATDDWPIGLQEARQHRQELIKEHCWNEMTIWGSMPGPSF